MLPARTISILHATALLLLATLPARAGNLRIAVTDLDVSPAEGYANFPVTVSWRLSGSGLDLPGGLMRVRLDFLQAGDVTKSITIWPGDPGALAGQNTVTLLPHELPPTGTYSIRVTAEGAEVTGTRFYPVSNPSAPHQQFTTPRGVDVNRVADSPYRGRIYVSEAVSGNAGARSTVEGVYVLSPDLSPAFPSARAVHAEIGVLGPWGGSVYSPHRVTVDNLGSVLICDASDPHAALFIADPDVSQVQPQFAYPYPTGGSRTAGGLVSTSTQAVHGSVAAVWSRVEAGSRTLITCDEDLSPANSIWRRTIPAGATDDATAPTLFASYAGAPWTQDLTADAAGNVYVISGLTNDARMYDPAGTLVRSLPANAVSYNGVCLDEERGSVYVGTGDGRIFVAAPDFTSSRAVVNGLGAQITDIACDADGWLYATNATTHRLDVFAPAGDAIVGGGATEAADALTLLAPPLPGDIAPVGPQGLHEGKNGQRYGDGAVDAADAAEMLRQAAGLCGSP